MPHTLLLADDSVTIQRVIELTFADEDVVVVAVSNGDQAIERLEASPPDIVLADIGMPGRNGYEVAKYIKSTPHLSHIPVVLLTGAFEPVDQERATEAGCDGVLAKPFEPQLVIGRVKELLAKGRRTPATVFAPGVTPPPKGPAPVPRTPPLDESLVTAPIAVTPPSTAEIGDYFDRLDAAFADLSSAPAFLAAKGGTPPAAGIAEEIDWFGADRASASTLADQWDLPAPSAREEPADLPLSYASPSRPPPPPIMTHNPPAPPPTVITTPVAVVQPSIAPPPAPARPAAPPLLADAFAALLAAEQDDSGPVVAPTWPGAAAPAPVVTDDVIEEIVRRVLDRLSDRVVRETVRDNVSKVAERLVREEIDRIKSSIK